MLIALDYDKLLQNKETPAYTKEAIRQLMHKGSLTVGQFVQTMSSPDIVSAVECYRDFMTSLTTPRSEGDSVDVGQELLGRSFLIFMEILAAGEGLDLDTRLSILAPRMQYLSVYLGVELMVRRGMPIQVHYENMTLSDEVSTSSKPIVSAKPGEEITEALRKRLKFIDSLLRLTPTKPLSEEELGALKESLLQALKSAEGGPTLREPSRGLEKQAPAEGKGRSRSWRRLWRKD